MGNNNRLEGTLVERTDGGAVIAALGTRLEGRARTPVAPGAAASGVIRVEKVALSDEPGANRVAMTLKTQMYIGERWELVFVKDGASVRAYTPAPLADGLHHMEFPPSALWIF
jgi:iron(III) transport system ATP-binding protein